MAVRSSNGELSRDGRWLAYESNDSGQFEVYVRPLPDVEAARYQISPRGGTRPVWGPQRR
jgi:Tol biopolymer transport system component